MPDRDACGYLYTLEGEAADAGRQMRREAQNLREMAADMDRKAEWHEQRAAWLREAADALNPVPEDER
jgi:hypothetical protein